MMTSDSVLLLTSSLPPIHLEQPAAGPFLVEIPFLEEIGAKILAMSDGQAQLALTLEKRHLNGRQVAHGGVVMTLLDAVMSMAGRSTDPKTRLGVTVEMKTSFMQPAGVEGAHIVAKGRVLHRSTTMVFCEAELWDGDQLAAKAMGTFKYLKPMSESGLMSLAR